MAHEQFLNQILHDLRAPMTALNLSIHSIQSQTDAGQKEFTKQLELAQVANRRLRQLVQTMSHSLSKAPTPQIEFIYTQEEINDCLLLVKEKLEIKKIKTIFLKPREALWLKHVKADFNRVILNLLNNAVDACIEGGTLVVTLKTTKNGKVIIEVVDNGIGIANSYLDKVFERGFTKGKGQGSGEGLTIVKKLVKRNFGSVQIESQIGKGTSITLKY